MNLRVGDLIIHDPAKNNALGLGVVTRSGTTSVWAKWSGHEDGELWSDISWLKRVELLTFEQVFNEIPAW